MRIGILALQGDFAAHAAAFERLGCQVELIRTPGQLAAADALALPGGESTTMLHFLDRGGFGDQLRAACRSRPTFATCAGAILLAREAARPPQPSLGLLDLTAVRNAYGRQLESSIQFATVEPAFQPALGAAPLEAVLIRAPKFEALGPAVEVVARGPGGEPLLVRQGSLVAASFHPELSGDLRVHRWFLSL
ncbi:MAG: pyridoxal 5'-phosphate synthase glutaminase subunit PdxT [Terriglobales bacterium]